ncbi:tyrosine-type recombinase/integrase [Vagococcus fluvialis]|uniref:tyrosine-type recombinase/integrase n=1 Tax=Vagococcus fluvialis TaxID=2738 RepID=UPI00288E8D2B|nr:tyrosine-type recombinase/integrase [Vagococcus fluvialis]MDT2781423.1 tyrosine-type recombinase/integrase [Vagococcus fluvialis]
MANIKSYQLADGSDAWMFKEYLGMNPNTKDPVRVTRRGFKTEKEAKIALARVQIEFEERDWEAELAEMEKETKYTFEEIYWNWLEEYQTTVKPSSLLKTERLFHNHLIPAFGDKYIDEITPMMAQEQMNKWHNEFVRARMMMNYVGSVFDYAMRLQIVSMNPTKLIRKPVTIQEVKEDEDLNFYDKEELKEFLAMAEKLPNKRAYTYFRLLAFTGMRNGEALALKWSDVDIVNKTLNINKGVSRKATGLYVHTPKTPSSIRRISLDDKTIEILNDFMKETNSGKDDLIFRNENNKLLTQSKSRKWLILTQDKIDENRKENMKRITIHGFRHTHASLLFEAGASIKDVQVRLGHSDIQTTMDVYTHVSKAAKEQLAEKFNSFIDF